MFDGGWYLNIDLEQRDHLATVDLEPNLIRIHGDVFVDGSENIFAKDGDKVGVSAGASFVHQQDRHCADASSCAQSTLAVRAESPAPAGQGLTRLNWAWGRFSRHLGAGPVMRWGQR